MSKIEITNLTFCYEGAYENVFENESFTLDTRWRLGLISRNGRGKTTLLRLLEGSYEHRGNIHSSVDFTYYPYAITDEKQDTKTIAAALAPNAEPWEIERELSLLEVSEDALTRSFLTLSNGERTKVLLAAMFLRENAFLLLDEPTNHLDAQGRKAVSRYLSRKGGFIVVSHDRDFLDGCIDHVLSINKSSITVTKGNYSQWWQNKARQDQFELTQNLRLEQEIKDLKIAAAHSAAHSDKVEREKIGVNVKKREKDIRTRSYLGEKSRKMMARSKQLEQRQNKAISEKSGLLKNLETTEMLKMHPLSYRKKVLVSGERLSLSFGEKYVFKELSFALNQGERIAITGKNGCGKSTLLKIILGELSPTHGILTVGNHLKISYIPQDTSYLRGSLKAFITENALNETIFKTNLRKLDFSAADFEKDMETFSDGQKKKTLLAKSLSEEAHLFLWDEPLNYIDIYTISQLEELLLNSGATMIFVEHDACFCRRMATKTIHL